MSQLFKLYQCIDCKFESEPWSTHYNGRHFLKTWHFKSHKKHEPRTGYTFFKDATFFKSLKHYTKVGRHERSNVLKAAKK